LLRPDELSEQIAGLSVPDEAAYETVGGYVMSELGRIASVGDTVKVGGGTLSVTRMDGRRIDRICFKPDREPGDGPAEKSNAGEPAAEKASAGAASSRNGSARDGSSRRGAVRKGLSRNASPKNASPKNTSATNGGAA
jgi:hypothetical protein